MVIETVWVLESAYQCVRDEIASLIENLLSAPAFFLPDSLAIRKAIRQYKNGGDFADLLIVGQAKKHQAAKLISFDKNYKNFFLIMCQMQLKHQPHKSVPKLTSLPTAHYIILI